jgi:hypothetical protein
MALYCLSKKHVSLNHNILDGTGSQAVLKKLSKKLGAKDTVLLFSEW